MADRMKCDKAPDGRHCLHGPEGLYSSTIRQSERCCWCGTEVAKHGPHAPGGHGDFSREQWGTLSAGRCACGARAGALHGCTSRMRVEEERFWAGDGWRA